MSTAATAVMELGMGTWMAPRKKGQGQAARGQSLVDEVINDFCEGSPSELARRLSKIIGKEIIRQNVNGWRVRGQFPPEIVPFVHRLTRIPLADLIERNRPRFKIPTQR